MKAAAQKRWSAFLTRFGEENTGRPTRLGVFEDGNDFWLEDGLPLSGIDVDPNGEEPVVEIMLGDFTHAVRDVRQLTFYVTVDGKNEGFDVTDASGKTAILRFER
jgi:hypothetical protein